MFVIRLKSDYTAKEIWLNIGYWLYLGHHEIVESLKKYFL
jgi:hypothetical protein